MNIHSTGMNTYIILKNNWCENMRKKIGHGFGTFVSETKFTVGFFIRRPGFRQPRTQGICSGGAKYPGMAWSRDRNTITVLSGGGWF